MLGGIIRDEYQIVFKQGDGEIGFKPGGTYAIFYARQTDYAESWLSALLKLSEMQKGSGQA
jgi:hypothetical protein